MSKKLFLFLTLFAFAKISLAQIPPVLGPIQGQDTICSAPSAPSAYSVSSSGLVTSYNWQVTPSAGVIINSNGGASVLINFPTGSGIYVISCYATSPAGPNSATVTSLIAVLETPQVTFSGGGTFCQGSSTRFQASPTTQAASSTISYAWQPPFGLNAYGLPNPIANPSVTTVYTVNYSLWSGFCTNSANVTFSVSLCLGVEEALMENKSALNVYPNPSNGTIYVRSNEERDAYIMDNLGRTVLWLRLRPDNEEKINSLAPGVYYLIAGERRLKIIISKE